MAKESQIEKKACDYAKSLGFLVFKFTSPGQRGVPDRCFISPAGAVLFLEFKTPGQKPDATQRAMMERLRKQGVAAGWASDYPRAARMITDFNHMPRSFNNTYDL